MTVKQYFQRSDFESERQHLETAADDKRDAFEHDYARIIHSQSFRSLQGKSQIFAPDWSDIFRTRVTHTMEVAQIGRSLAIHLDAPVNLVETACLAHDLGHPPFGHTGEEALASLTAHSGGYEGNAQTFHILTDFERKSTAFRGLNLTRATLSGVIKYPYLRSSGFQKYLYDESVSTTAEWLFHNTNWGLLKEPVAQPRRSIIADIMDWADDIAYSIHDLEDGLNSGFLTSAHFTKTSYHRAVQRRIEEARAKAKVPRETVAEVMSEFGRRLDSQYEGPLKGQVKETLRHYIDRFVASTTVVSKRSIRSAADFRVVIPDDVRQECETLKQVTMEFVVGDYRTAIHRQNGKLVIERLFETFYENTLPSAGKYRFELFPPRVRTSLRRKASEAELIRGLSDYIASLTDAQALRLHAQLFESATDNPFTRH